MISHLHIVHGYPLCKCTRDHHTNRCEEDCAEDHHLSCSLELSGEFRYETDAKLDKKLRNIAIPPVSLIEYRKAATQSTARKKIQKFAALDHKGDRSSEEEDSDESKEASEAAPICTLFLLFITIGLLAHGSFFQHTPRK